MSHQSLEFDVVEGASTESVQAAPKGLVYEKFGVITGFLVGLMLALGLVDAHLLSAGTPEWLTILVAAVVVSTFTSIGLRLGILLARSLNKRRSA